MPQPKPPEYLFGQAQVKVRGNEDPIIRLGLAQHGPIVVEFPASDNFFAVHPGGSNIVTYDESPTLATDHCLVFRAGGGFMTGTDAEGSNEARASISGTAPVDLDDQKRMTVVAVKNTTQAGLRILPGGPELDVQTLSETGQVVQVRSIKLLQTASSGAGGALPAGATIYYAIIYEAPVLDAAQRVRLSVAQDTAADQPASTELSRTN